MEDKKPKRNMDLRGGKADAAGIEHGLDHVVDETLNFGMRRVRHRGRALQQNRVAHPGDLENGQGRLQLGWDGKRLEQADDHDIAPA